MALGWHLGYRLSLMSENCITGNESHDNTGPEFCYLQQEWKATHAYPSFFLGLFYTFRFTMPQNAAMSNFPCLSLPTTYRELASYLPALFSLSEADWLMFRPRPLASKYTLF